MTTKPEIGSIVRYGRTLYEVVGHDCLMTYCTHGKGNSLKVFELVKHRNGWERRWTTSQCLPADKVEVHHGP
jgi:hypothetical protein